MIKKIIFDRIDDLKAKLKEERKIKLVKIVPPEREDELVARIEELKWMLAKFSKAERDKFSSKI